METRRWGRGGAGHHSSRFPKDPPAEPPRQEDAEVGWGGLEMRVRVSPRVSFRV